MSLKNFKQKTSFLPILIVLSAAVLLFTLVILKLSALRASADTLNDFSCTTGTALALNQMTISSASGGWGDPVTDATRLLDNDWTGWAPNYGSVAWSIVNLGSSINLKEVQLFTSSGVSGDIQIEYRNSTTGTWQSVGSIILNQEYKWLKLTTNVQALQLRLTRNSETENAIELRNCYNTSSPTATPTLTPPPSTGSTTTPWQTKQTASYSSVLTGDGSAEHLFGYQFTPVTNGYISQLGGYFNGAKTIVVFNNSGTIIAQANVTSNYNWVFTNLTSNVNLIANNTYVVAVRMGTASTGTLRWGVTFPFTEGNIKVNGAVQGWATNATPSTWTMPSLTNDSNMKGFVDIKYSNC